jgi:hypothetical protein
VAARWLRSSLAIPAIVVLLSTGGLAVRAIAYAQQNGERVSTIAHPSDGSCLDAGAGPVGTVVITSPCRGTTAQAWRITSTSTGGYTVASVATGRCLDVKGAGLRDATPIVTRRCHRGAHQRFEQRPAGGDRHRVHLVASHSGKCVTAGGANAPATQAGCADVAAAATGQVWLLGDAGRTASPPTTPATDSPLATVDYPASDAAPANPERGFMRFADCAAGELPAAVLATYRAEGVSLVFCMIYLRAFRTSDIDAATLRLLQRQFDTVRAAGLKTVLRFAYTDSDAGDDAAPAQVLRHIAQLRPLLRGNADVITVVQAGFVGAWGEWYYTRNFGNAGTISATDRTNRRAVVDALLEALPATRMVQLRTPGFKRGFYGASALTAGHAHSGEPAARVGHHNDCFLGSADDVGTYVEPAVERPYLQAETTYLPMGGETCAANPPRSDCGTALRELAEYHWSYLNADYHPDVLGRWRGAGCMPEVQRRLGYRFTLTQGRFATGARAGGALQVRLDIRNDGWAAPFNPRAVQLVLRDDAGATVRRLPVSADPRTWRPGATATIHQSVAIPADLPAGTYRLALALPDQADALAQRPEYAVQTANVDLWDARTGVNDLRHTVTVTG